MGSGEKVEPDDHDSFEVQQMGVNPCPLCTSRDVRATDYGIKCRGCGIELREPSEYFEEVRDRWNALRARATPTTENPA